MHHGNAILRLVFLSLVALITTPEVAAEDWPQFRGPNRDGTWQETDGILQTIPASGLKVKWRHPVGGGFSSPVVTQGRVFLFDVELVKPASKERIHCYDEKTGKLLWEFTYAEHYGEWTFDPERGAGPTATPIVEGNRLYTVGANGHIHCLNIKTGKVIWRKNLWDEYTVEEMGCRPSPLIEGSLLIVFTTSRPGATLLALDKMTGKEVWKSLDEHASNSSPIAIQSGGTRQLIVWTDAALVSVNPRDGSIFWRETMWTSNNDDVACPVFDGNRLLLSGLMMKLSEDRPAMTFVWPENRVPANRILSNTSTPWLNGEYIYSCKKSGDLVCLEASTGKTIWSTNGITQPKNGAAIHITPQGDGVFLFTDEGNLIRAELSPSGYREKGRFHLIDPTWPFNGNKFVYAPPAFANRHVFARSEAEIVCASLEAEKGRPHPNRELIRDQAFQGGFSVSEPKPGKHVVYMILPGLATQDQPAWILSQWESRFPLVKPLEKGRQALPFLVFSNAAKSIRYGKNPEKADLILGIHSGVEYPRLRQSGEPWVHWLVEQEFGPVACLTDLSKVRFHLEGKLLKSNKIPAEGYNSSIHAAQFQIFLTVQNLNRESPGYGDALWFGIPLYDDRAKTPPAHKTRDTGGTGRYIFTPAGDTYTTRSFHEGQWVTIEKDLLPLLQESLRAAWQAGFLQGSKTESDYYIGGMNMGWEVTGMFDVEFAVRDLSLQITLKP